MSEASLSKKAFAEFLGTIALLCAVIGSGIMAERLSGGNVAIALLANTLTTVFALYVLIETLGPVSGAHFNPLVTIWALFFDRKRPLAGIESAQSASVFIAAAYIVAQLAGAATGAWLAHAMFDMSIFQTSAKLRGGWGQWIAEAVATGGLLFVIIRSGAAGVNAKASAMVACYIGAAYWFTASTSFANPAAVFGRMLSDSFAGIAPVSALGFVAAQCVGAALGVSLAKLLAVKPVP
ncbi:MIP/aquaporin family protein [Variovorax sp. PCZ-1]|uniref:aquaporin n=1 Tax=Variovorax sp. PCZ-1 TaxID=2835533 RepID=UPI001BCBFE98|nr:MIP/aquaporin family protein [Variovorax sp. PCZ-1]MBS7806697.1 aquaporin family protein [Variovorax sp. PCZ-1]